MRRATVTRCPHLVLGINKDANKQEIKDAFKGLAKQHHPDRGGSGEEFAKIRQAFEAMMLEEGKRKEGDELREKERGSYDEDISRAYPRKNEYRSKATWAEPGVRVDHGSRAEDDAVWIYYTARLVMTGIVGYAIGMGIAQDVDEDGLTWLEKPHPAVLASRPTDNLTLAQKFELESLIIKASKNTTRRFKMGPGLHVQGIGYLNYETDTITRSPEFLREIERSKRPTPVAKWKHRRQNTPKSGVPPIALSEVTPTPVVDPAAQVYQERIKELEEKLRVLEEKEAAK